MAALCKENNCQHTYSWLPSTFRRISFFPGTDSSMLVKPWGIAGEEELDQSWLYSRAFFSFALFQSFPRKWVRAGTGSVLWKGQRAPSHLPSACQGNCRDKLVWSCTSLAAVCRGTQASCRSRKAPLSTLPTLNFQNSHGVGDSARFGCVLQLHLPFCTVSTPSPGRCCRNTRHS